MARKCTALLLAALLLAGLCGCGQSTQSEADDVSSVLSVGTGANARTGGIAFTEAWPWTLDPVPVMTPDTPVAVKLNFMGTIPNYGVSYVDGNGDQRCFFLIESGYNGSVQMVEAQPYEELLWSIPGG